MAIAQESKISAHQSTSDLEQSHNPLHGDERAKGEGCYEACTKARNLSWLTSPRLGLVQDGFVKLTPLLIEQIPNVIDVCSVKERISVR